MLFSIDYMAEDTEKMIAVAALPLEEIQMSLIDLIISMAESLLPWEIIQTIQTFSN